METVIVLPLFLVLLGGIMWIGQLIFDKQKMVVADRYAAWNLGNRWRATEWKNNPDSAGAKITTEIQDFFYGRSLDEIKVFTPKLSSVNGWIWQASAGMQVTAHMPDWTKGLLYSGVIAFNANPLETDAALTGRDVKNSSGMYIGHSVFMRTDNHDSRTSSITPDDPNIDKLKLPTTYHF